MLRWDTAGLTDIDSNMWYTSKVSAHVLLPQMPCESEASPRRLQVTSQPHNPKTTMLPVRTATPHVAASILYSYTRTVAEALSERRNTGRWQKFYEITLFSEGAVIPFFFFAGKLQTEILKWHAVRLTGGASKNTHGTQNKFFLFVFFCFFKPTTLPTSHTISMHTFCRQIGR